ncbi:cysteine hydrolase family protein [Kitasatospora sp. NPDC050463]|uniref:cysteine hydrolase family protein n=1 Tax=Kitasatospora sp. NPDC050463 TaxID=3155786 RepID=UPI0033F330A7
MSAQPTASQAPAQVHDWVIPQREYARQERRRGRRHADTRLDPARTALVVVDMVPFFDGPYERGIIPQIEALAVALRRAGGLVAWVLPGDGEPTSARQEFYGPEVAEMFRTSGGSGPLAERLWPQFTVDGDRDLLVEKEAASAFFPGLCPLPDLLAERGIDTCWPQRSSTWSGPAGDRVCGLRPVPPRPAGSTGPAEAAAGLPQLRPGAEDPGRGQRSDARNRYVIRPGTAVHGARPASDRRLSGGTQRDRPSGDEHPRPV